MTLAKTSKALNIKGGQGVSYADKRREEKRQALREFLQGHKYLEDIHKDLARTDLTDEQLAVIKFKTETRLKLLAKVLPDIARTEMTGADGDPIQVQDMTLHLHGVAAKK